MPGISKIYCSGWHFLGEDEIHAYDREGIGIHIINGSKSNAQTVNEDLKIDSFGRALRARLTYLW